MPRCRAARGAYVSTSAAAAADVTAPAHAPAPAPRGAARDAAIAAAAAADVAARARAPEEWPRGSMTAAAFAAPPADATALAQSVAGARAAARGAGAARPAPDGAAEMGAAARPEAYEAAGTHYSRDAPVTAFAARACELTFPFSFPPPRAAPSGGAGAALAAAGGAALPPHVTIPGAELSLAPLFTRLARRLRDAGAGVDALAADARARAPALLAAAARDAARLVPPAFPEAPPPGRDVVPARALRAAAHALRCGIADADLEACVRAAAPVALARKAGADAAEQWVDLGVLLALSALAVP
jgi:hypothetical protein